MVYVKTGIEKTQTTISAITHSRGGFAVEIESPNYLNREDADKFAALLPKCVRARSISCGGYQDESGNPYSVYYVRISADQSINIAKVTGSENETGMKRISSAIRALKKAGIEIVPRLERCSNAMPVAEVAAKFLA